MDDINSLILISSCSQPCINFYYENVNLSADEALNLCSNTKNRMGKKWHSERKIRITGSISYAIFTYEKCNWNHKLNSIVLFKEHVQHFQGNQATRFGLDNEPNALRKYEEVYNYKIINAGLVANIHCSWLGYSPDGFVKINNEIILLAVKYPMFGKIQIF